jgi:hypothetical protein
MGEARHKAGPDGIANPDHDDGKCRRCLLGRLRRGRTVGYHDVHGEASQLHRGPCEPLRPCFRRSIFNGDVPAFDVAKVAQSLPKGVPPSRGIDDADAWDFRRLLRARRERPRGRRAAE